jgi:hypothetical protein
MSEHRFLYVAGYREPQRLELVFRSTAKLINTVITATAPLPMHISLESFCMFSLKIMWHSSFISSPEPQWTFNLHKLELDPDSACISKTAEAEAVKTNKVPPNDI